jgi:predicted methyltransferase
VGPLLTAEVLEHILLARRSGAGVVECSLDLQRSLSAIEVRIDDWLWNRRSYPYPEVCKQRTIYYWTGESFQRVARYASSLVKLVPTQWGPPTFEIDCIKMLPTAHISPYEDAERKVNLIQPRGKTILDTCGGLGYFAGACLSSRAARILSYEKNPDVIWLRSLNPWSPTATASALRLAHGDITHAVIAMAAESVDAVLHDPPRFGTAGELYSLEFYCQLARVLKRRGRLFHYTGTPNKLTTGRNVPNEVANRLRQAGFTAEKTVDGVLAIKS